MSKGFLLAKAVVVPGKDTLNYEECSSFYLPAADMYIYSSVAFFDPLDGFNDVRIMHDKIIRQYPELRYLKDDMFNCVTVDLSRIDRNKTFLSYNKRQASLSDDQLAYLRKAFNVSE